MNQSAPSLSQTLNHPVGALMRPTSIVAPEDSLIRSAGELRRNGGDVLPIAQDGLLLGVLTEQGLGLALADARDLTDPVAPHSQPATTIAPYATGAEALRKLAETGVSALVVVDDRRHVLGLLSSTDLLPRRRVHPRPAMVGGMATPFGVYLTNGVVHGGAGGVALICTGAVMFGMLYGAQLLVSYSLPALLAIGVPASYGDLVQTALGPTLFLVAMRLAPLSGTHAAEHQVVHALERGEDLVPDVVRRMPRVHPRCGTNLAAGATLFLGIFATEWIPSAEVRLLVAFFVTLVLWRRLGALLQQFVTTRPATDRQLQSGIRAAEELLTEYATARVATPHPLQRIWNSGVLQVMAGSALMALTVYLLSLAFNLPVQL